jgi:hypothetical protein
VGAPSNNGRAASSSAKPNGLVDKNQLAIVVKFFCKDNGKGPGGLWRAAHRPFIVCSKNKVRNNNTCKPFFGTPNITKDCVQDERFLHPFDPFHRLEN